MVRKSRGPSQDCHFLFEAGRADDSNIFLDAHPDGGSRFMPQIWMSAFYFKGKIPEYSIDYRK